MTKQREDNMEQSPHLITKKNKGQNIHNLPAYVSIIMVVSMIFGFSEFVDEPMIYPVVCYCLLLTMGKYVQ